MPRAQAQDIILEILRQADGEWTGKTRLFKAFYFAHLYYATDQPGLLTNWPIVRLAQGPGIGDSDRLFGELVRAGYLVIENVHEGPYPEYRYRLTDQGRAAARPPDDAQVAVKEATIFCQSRTAAELSQLTHERSRSWLAGKEGDVLDIYLDVIPEDEFQRREAEITRLDVELQKALGGENA